MSAHLVVAAALVVASAPVSPPRPGAEEAGELYDRGDYLQAAAVASRIYTSPAEPLATRLEHARLAQEAFSRAYETTAATGVPRPDYLCRALDILDATASLAVDEEDITRHETLAATHRETLTTRHPDHVCAGSTELLQIPAIRQNRVRAPIQPEPAPGPAPAPINTDTPRINRAPAALKISGAVTMSLGVVALAVMTGGLGIHSRAQKAASPLTEAKNQQHGRLTVEQGRELATLAEVTHGARQMALAGGISGAVLVVLGATLVGWGHAWAAHARVSPMAGHGRAGLFVEGRF